MDVAAHSSSVAALLARLWRGLQPRRRRQFVLIMGLMVLSAFAEVASLGAVLPFLGILTAPDKVFSNHWVARRAHAAGDQLAATAAAAAYRRVCA